MYKHGLRGATIAIAAMLVANLSVPDAVAEVKVRSYDRGSKTEQNIDKRKGVKPGSGSNSRSRGKTGGVAGRGDLPPAEDNFEAGEVLMANPSARLEKDLARLGMKVVDRVTLKNLDFSYVRIQTPDKMPVRKAIGMLQSRYPSATVDANHRYELSAATSLGRVFPRKAAGWGAATPNCGQGLRIGLIDGAVDVDNPILKGQQVTYRSFHDVRRNPAPTGHGTSVAAMFVGTIQRNGWSGLVPGAELFAASMFEIDRRDQVVGSSTGMLRAMDWLIEMKVHVINLSIAGGDNEILKKAVEIARRKRVVLVAAVGNGGLRGEPAYPAAYPEVIAVTAVSGARRKAYEPANQGSYIDFAAPGTSMWIPTREMGKAFSGTSFAAPYVSVIVAEKVANEDSSSDPNILRSMIRRNVIDLGRRGKDDVFGFGMVHEGPSCDLRQVKIGQHDQ